MFRYLYCKGLLTIGFNKVYFKSTVIFGLSDDR